MDLSHLKEAVAGLKEKEVYTLVDQFLTQGRPANDILKAFREGMATIGEMYDRGEAFVAEMMYAGDIMRNVMKKLSPAIEKEGGKQEIVGKVIIGTVKGDIHDLGKDVVILALQGHGFEVVDLGVDVPAEKFVEAIRSHPDAKVVGMSVFLTSVFGATGKTVKTIEDAGLRDQVKIMVGGGPVTNMVAKKTGCDFYGEDALAGVKYSKEAYAI